MFDRPLNRRFDARKAERHGETVSGFLSWQDMPELAQVTENPATDRIGVSVRFERTDDRVHAMHLAFDGTAKVLCQRCLEVMEVDMSGACSLALVMTEAAIERLPEGWEVNLLDEDGSVDVYRAAQEELLLRVPMVPKHTENCGLIVNQDDDPVEKPNPFAVLAQLKGSK